MELNHDRHFGRIPPVSTSIIRNRDINIAQNASFKGETGRMNRAEGENRYFAQENGTLICAFSLPLKRRQRRGLILGRFFS